jgi:hypothetical protein
MEMSCTQVNQLYFQFLLIGGRTAKSNYSSHVWTLSLGISDDPSNPPWMSLRSLPYGRHSHTCFMHDGKVFVVGGATESDGDSGTDAVMTYSLADNKWREFKPIPFGPLIGAAAVHLGSLNVPTLIGGSRRQTGLIQVTTIANTEMRKWLRQSFISAQLGRRLVPERGRRGDGESLLSGGSHCAATVGVRCVTEIFK